MAESESTVIGITRKSLHGRVIYACPKCAAPGVFSDAEPIKQGWPGCYAPASAGQPVGDICPNCGANRNPDWDKGELQASIPMWLWTIIQFAKRLVVWIVKLKRKFL